MADYSCTHAKCGLYVTDAAPPAGLKMCAKCKQVAYCSKQCQIHDWKCKHKHDCFKIIAGGLTTAEGRMISYMKMLVDTDNTRGVFECTEEAIEIAKCIKSRHPFESALIYFMLASCQPEECKSDSAMRFFNMSMDIYEEFEGKHKNLEQKKTQKRFLLRTYNELGRIYRDKRYFRKARELCNKAFKVIEEIDDMAEIDKNWMILTCLLDNSVHIYLHVGEYEKALAEAKKAFAITKKSEILKINAAGGHNLAVCFSTAGQYMKAINLWERSEDIFETIGCDDDMQVVMLGIGESWAMLGNYAKAIEYNVRALEITKKSANTGHEARALVNMGMTLLQQEIVERQTSILAGNDIDWCDCELEQCDCVQLPRVHRARVLMLKALEYGEYISTLDAALNLSYIALEMNDEEEMFKYLRRFLSVVYTKAQTQCEGCSQDRSEGVSMLRCGECKVSR